MASSARTAASLGKSETLASSAGGAVAGGITGPVAQPTQVAQTGRSVRKRIDIPFLGKRSEGNAFGPGSLTRDRGHPAS